MKKYNGPERIVSITMRNNMRLLDLACTYVEQFAGGIGMSEEKVDTVVANAREVLRRRMTYAYKGIGDITLDIFAGIDRIVIEVADKGTPYWIDVDRQIRPYKRKADQYVLKKLGREGQRFSMSFMLEPDIDIVTFRKQDGADEVLLDDNMEVYRIEANEKEINEVMKCIYSNYGYEYPNYVIYEPAEMKSLLMEGRQWSYLARNDHGQIMAHASLAFHEELPGVPEIGALVCKEFCRGRNVAGKIVENICVQAEKSGVRALFGMPVAFHPYSQKILGQLGFVPTGAVLHYVPSFMVGPYADGDRRMDVLVGAKVLSAPGSKAVSVPEKHVSFVQKLYSKLGISCEILPPSEGEGEAVYSVSYSSDLKMAEIQIDNAPESFSEDLSEMMRDLSSNRIEMIEVYLNISNPSASWAYEILEGEGFYFSGIIPCSEKGEYMIMANLMGIPMEWDKLVTDGDYSEVVEYIRENQ